ncbi:MAG: hypothetical protein LBR17_03800, partial [Bacteroidales bacterium]|nr:hypothetical protein [Bacteroidales bacterium]
LIFDYSKHNIFSSNISSHNINFITNHFDISLHVVQCYEKVLQQHISYRANLSPSAFGVITRRVKLSPTAPTRFYTACNGIKNASAILCTMYNDMPNLSDNRLHSVQWGKKLNKDINLKYIII